MSSLAQIWSSFLQAPKLEQLTGDATLTYITSCKQFTGPKNIINQMSITTEGLKSRQDEVAVVHEASSSIVSEVAASFVFDFNGKMNPFLPGLDDNMFSGKRVELPMIYIVTFIADQIRSIRVFWDQATVLKQIDVIGTRGRGWPVYDGPEQSRYLKDGHKPEKRQNAPENYRPNTGTNDPHASLDLYEKKRDMPRSDYGPQDYQQPVRPESRNYNELFVNEGSARPDELTQRLGQGHQRQVTLSGPQNGSSEEAMKKLNLNESIGQAGRSSHFEFGTPDANASAYQKNEIPLHHKGGMKDHNESTENYYAESFKPKPRPDMNSHFEIGGQSPSPALQSAHRGPPTAQFDAFSEQAPEHNVHGREYNMARRPPPQSQYNFMAGQDDDVNAVQSQSSSRAASHLYNQEKDQSQGQDVANIHNREYNMARRPPPQAQYDFMSDSAAPAPEENFGRASQRRFTPTEEPTNIHGREFNMSRRPPPQAQYNFMEDSNAPEENNHGRASEETFGRASQRRFTPTEEPTNIHGREFNMSRRPPPQAQYNFMEDADAPQEQTFGRASQRKFTPSYDLGDGQDNIHGREYNMGRRGPPAPQSNLF